MSVRHIVATFEAKCHCLSCTYYDTVCFFLENSPAHLRVDLCQAHLENLPQASKWFNILLARVPSDPGILCRMGHIANKEDDDSQAYFYHKER